MGALGVAPPDIAPHATQEIAPMVAMIERLIEHGNAYEAQGHVLFSVPSDPNYGILSKRDREHMIAGARVEVAPYKRDPSDFVLWKPSPEGVIGWDSRWGRGRPGWHIECSAMIERHFGETIDVHGGGLDLIFPHHENEIAQAEGATKQLFSRFWVHVEHLFVENEKMSKSIGNVHTVPDVVAKGYRASALRYLLLSSHYRKQLNFTWAGMDQAEESLRRVVDFLARLDDVRGGEAHPDVDAMVAKARSAFRQALESDLNTAAALAAIFDLITEGNTAIDAKRLGAADAALIRGAIDEFDRVLGVVSLRRAEDSVIPDELRQEMERLIEERKAAKQRRDFAAADKIRDDLAKRGILLEDHPGGLHHRRPGRRFSRRRVLLPDAAPHRARAKPAAPPGPGDPGARRARHVQALPAAGVGRGLRRAAGGGGLRGKRSFGASLDSGGGRSTRT